METKVVITLRVATKEDFSNSDGSKKLEVPYLYMNSKGILEQKIYHFNEDTDLETFRNCYAHYQVFVFDNINELQVVKT